MARSGIVLVHGGLHTGACWSPTVAALWERAPDVPVLAVDLPGHGSTPGDPESASIAGNAASVVEQIEEAGLDRVLLVGHSLAGITVPAVVELLGIERVHRIVLVSSLVPRQGSSALGELPPPLGQIARAAARRRSVLNPLPFPLTRWAFGNGMTRAQRTFLYSVLTPQSLRPAAERVDRSAFPDVPSTWVLTLRDHVLSVRAQRRFMANLGSVDEVVSLDTCHDAMISAPDQLADLLLARCSSA
jgi:pimeloyl-ACP methyl ester carboxylesterase